HGMTMGELATWFVQNELKDRNVKLNINYLDNWQPHRLFPECSLPWKAPSPNMSTPETALLYIGMCLIEGTNLNEGRGTETPFSILGAPWLDADAVVGDMGEDDLPGLSLSAVSYTPRSIPGKSANPKFRDVACRGIRLTVTDAKNVCAFRMVIAVLQSTRMRHPDDFDFIPFFDTLVGGPDLRTRIEAGESTESIIERYDEQHTAFEEIRPRLYDDDGIPYEFIEAHAHQHP
ncbi:MAG: exo-beta-N-acetylmuramidase NamZ domain-containing protein, partial [Candidatus Hydrogenedentota bacterium]